MRTRFLIVDDNDLVRQSLRTVLQANPEWEIVGEASNGQDALEIFKTSHPNVVILDFQMPGMNGIETAHAFWKLRLRCRSFYLRNTRAPNWKNMRWPLALVRSYLRRIPSPWSESLKRFSDRPINLRQPKSPAALGFRIVRSELARHAPQTPGDYG
jgi:response regulator RpfG family c-di-GMP phosphodiesterase